MAARNKIMVYNLGPAAEEMSARGLTTMEIAEELSRRLQSDGINDSVSQPSVARYLKKVREDRAAQTKQIVHEHLKTTIPKDLEALDEIEAYFLAIFRDEKINPETKEVEPAGFTTQERARAAMNARVIIETKLRYSGVLEDPDKEAAARRVADEIESSLGEDLRRDIDAVSKSQAGSDTELRP